MVTYLPDGVMEAQRTDGKRLGHGLGAMTQVGRWPCDPYRLRGTGSLSPLVTQPGGETRSVSTRERWQKRCIHDIEYELCREGADVSEFFMQECS
jgi:hypothetical protein